MIRSFLNYYRKDRIALLGLGAIALAITGMETGTLLVIAPLMQAAAEGSESYRGTVGPIAVDLSIQSLAVIAVSLVVIAYILQILSARLVSATVSGIQGRTRRDFVAGWQTMSLEGQADMRGERIIQMVAGESGTAGRAVQDLALFGRGVAGVTTFTAGAVLVSPVATFVVVGVGSVVFLMMKPLNRLSRQLAGASVEANLATTEELTSMIHTSGEIATFGVQKEASKALLASIETQRRLGSKANFVGSVVSPTIRASGLMLIVGLIAYTAQFGGIEVTAAALVAVFLLRSVNYGQTVASQLQKLNSMAPVLDRLASESMYMKDRQRTTGTVKLRDISRIVVDSVAYTYPGASVPVLTGISLVVNVGEIVGIVGPSGSGKTTFTELLMGTRPASSGSILYGGYSPMSISDECRSLQVAAVPQRTTLIPGTVADNVRFFRGATPTEISRAIAGASLSEEVEEFPHGLDTKVGPGLRQLSGGQVQRIGIARALLGEPDVIIFDEPTSALDARAEATISNTIGSLGGDRIVFVVAHRLTTLKNCNRIIVIEGGVVTADGPLEELRRTSAFIQFAYESGTL